MLHHLVIITWKHLIWAVIQWLTYKYMIKYMHTIVRQVCTANRLQCHVTPRLQQSHNNLWNASYWSIANHKANLLCCWLVQMSCYITPEVSSQHFVSPSSVKFSFLQFNCWMRTWQSYKDHGMKSMMKVVTNCLNADTANTLTNPHGSGTFQWLATYNQNITQLLTLTAANSTIWLLRQACRGGLISSKWRSMLKTSIMLPERKSPKWTAQITTFCAPVEYEWPREAVSVFWLHKRH